MELNSSPPIQVFDPAQDFSVVERRLPHWSQAGTICFITWRTWDSIPSSVLQKWLAEQEEWLQRHNVVGANLQSQPQQAHSREFQLFIAERWNAHLDDCHGDCVLRRPEFSKLVADCLRHFDGDRYDLTDFVVMPNHVHLLAAFQNEEAMLKQCESWKHFTATKINRALGRKSRFWQQDGFDHLVRSAEQFEYLRAYIAQNPIRANLRAREYRHESKALR